MTSHPWRPGTSAAVTELTRHLVQWLSNRSQPPTPEEVYQYYLVVYGEWKEREPAGDDGPERN